MDHSSTRNKPERLVFLCLGLFLVVFPLFVSKPGMPVNLKADESAYYLMALSFWEDGDVLCEPHDLQRAYREFLHPRINNLILISDDGWNTVYFGKPFFYSLLAAPFVAGFGANGMVALNMALLMVMIWLGATYLRTYNAAGTAMLYSAGFFVLSSAFAYTFWLQPEILNMTCITIAYFLVLHKRGRDPNSVGWKVPALSAAAFAPAIYNKPMLGLLALPLLFSLLRDRGWRTVFTWCLASLLCFGALGGGSTLLTGHPWPYVGVSHRLFTVSNPLKMPMQTAEVAVSDEEGMASSRVSALGQRLSVKQLIEESKYFLFGRHVGIFLYLPFATVSFLLFLLNTRRSGRRWLLLACLALTALSFIVLRPGEWHGGGSVGNRYFVNAYPAFLFFVTRIRPLWLTPVGFALAGILVGRIVFTPFGASVAYPTLQRHIRDLPFRAFPLELTLTQSGYKGSFQGDVWFRGRRDNYLSTREGLWIQGADKVELWMHTPAPLGEAIFRVRSLAATNRVRVCLESDCQQVEFGSDPISQANTRLTLQPGKPRKVNRRKGNPVYIYRLTVTSTNGEQPRWRVRRDSQFYVGAKLLYLGSPEDLNRDLYHAAWARPDLPEGILAGSTFDMPIQLTNSSQESWPAAGVTRVALSYHWLKENHEVVIWDGRRTELPHDLAPGEILAVRQHLVAPENPGNYTLELDLVREEVDWFSRRGDSNTTRINVQILPNT